jgi:uncharacterized protein YerC
MFGKSPKIGLISTILPVNIIKKLRSEEELQAVLESIQILSNYNENNAIFQEIEECDEIQIIEKTKTRQISINQILHELLDNLKFQATKLTEMSEKQFCQGNIGDSVKVKISDVHRAHSDLRCVLSVIISSNNFITY